MPTILLVDDELQLRQLLAHQLSQTGYEVLEAGDGADATELLSAVQVDLVITDINMPKLDGISLAKWILGKWPRVPIILLSGFLPREANAILLIPTVRFIRKPTSVDGLNQAIRRLLAARAVA
jgi:CheY-like chemotaxis protein